MKILIIYGTYSTGTLTVAEKAKDMLTKKGHTVAITRNDQTQSEDLLTHDLVIMGSPSWKVFGKQGMPHEQYYPMIERLKGQRYDKPFAVYSLGDESYALVCGSADHLQGFVKELGGHEIIEPLKLEGFYFAEEERTKELNHWINTLNDTITSTSA
ncbi:MAG: flavodoxin family protein [Patescibacteria group bacterium]